MASITGSSFAISSLSSSFKPNKAYLKTSSLSIKGISFPSLRLKPTTRRLSINCAAKPETVDKVCEIVKKQLALPGDSVVNGESKFAALGADSLDTFIHACSSCNQISFLVTEDLHIKLSLLKNVWNAGDLSFLNCMNSALAVLVIDVIIPVQVEIVMGLEEAFGITVEEENAQSIATVQDAADLIEDLVAKKC